MTRVLRGIRLLFRRVRLLGIGRGRHLSATNEEPVCDQLEDPVRGRLSPSQLVRRLRGFSTPFFGLSWEALPSDRAAVREVVTFLENRRVLYSMREMEKPPHCIRSAIEIRDFVTTALGRHEASSQIEGSLREIRMAARDFVDNVQLADGTPICPDGIEGGAGLLFCLALGELRYRIGVQVATLAGAFGFDLEPGLASITPSAGDTPSL